MRMFFRRINVGIRGTKKYSGGSEEICKKIIEDCWNGKYFMTSAGHFSDFYTRDFGWCCESLIKLGYREKVKSTLEYALRNFRRKGYVTTTINTNGVAYDFPCYAVDSLAYLIRSLKLLRDREIVENNEEFLNKQVRLFYELVVDKNSGLVKKDTHFSSMKDHAVRKSSCYDNCMVGMLSLELSKLKIENPLKKWNYAKLIKENFWNGDYFLDDLSGTSHIAGDAQIIPFYSGLVNDNKMLRKCLEVIKKEGLDKPVPLRYSKIRLKQELIYLHLLASNYEKNTCWQHLGMMFLDVLSRFDREKLGEYLNIIQMVIERDKNFLEVYCPNGKPYSNIFYYADEGMLWASVYLRLKKKF